MIINWSHRRWPLPCSKVIKGRELLSLSHHPLSPSFWYMFALGQPCLSPAIVVVILTPHPMPLAKVRACCSLLFYVLSTSFLAVNIIKGRVWNDKSKFDEVKDKSQFRDYDAACDRFKTFYKEQHGSSPSQRLYCRSIWQLSSEKQTVAYNIKTRVDFKNRRSHMGVWEAIKMLNTLIADSDPDVSLRLSPHKILYWWRQIY